jgi:hypothetical protein
MRRNPQYRLPVSALVAFWLLTSATSGVAADPSFYINLFSMVEVGSIEGFPADVKKILGRQNIGAGGIADRWEKFNATDVVDNHLPMRRFITGGSGTVFAVVAYEQGGRGHSIRAATFGMRRSGWVMEGQWTLQEKPYDLRGLLQLIENQINPTHQTVARPIRRENPLRELNINEDEVLEIQSAALQVYPGSIVNISGVVTGCPCEDGLGCSDQVWIVAHKPGYSQGLQMSRVNGHWGIGVVQQWWLNFDKLGALRVTSREAYDKALKNLYDSYPACVNKPTSSTQETASRPYS